MSEADPEEHPELMAHLAAEREWYDVSTAHLDSLSSRLRSEMEARVPERQRSGTWTRPRFSYYTETAKNRDYQAIWRESRHDPATSTAKSAVVAEAALVLDVNTLDAGTGYLDLGLSIVSPDEDLLAYAIDTAGDERFTLRFRDLCTGQDLPDVIENVGYSGAWAGCRPGESPTFLYTVPDDAWRSERIRAHRLGADVAEDCDVVVERDRRFEVTVRLSRSQQAILVHGESRETSEVWYVDPADPELVPRSLGGRRDGVIYSAEHVRDGGFLLVTNEDAVEFRLMSCAGPGEPWVEVRPEEPTERLDRVDAFAGYVVASYRHAGDNTLRVLDADDLAGPGRVVTTRFPGGELWLGRNTWYDAETVAVTDESLTEPVVHATVSLADADVTDDHRDEAPGHDPAAYVTEVRTFPSADGTPVPATIVRHRDTPLDGTAPALLFGYGAYEYAWEREWEEPLPSFLDRGVVFVRTHIRGGGEGGRRWWLDGRLHTKQHTFDDHIAVADGLAAAGLVDPTRIVSRGLSAGGLLQGAVFTQRPERWRAVVAEVPFVDVVTSMSDDTLPLTVNEREEWGDPRDRADFDAMLAYSPYDNPAPVGVRPDLLVTGAVHDTRVLVREPAKWVAMLRATDPDWAPRCLFRAETGTGSHVGPSGRLDHLRYEADVAAWILDRLGVADAG
jgi:oligopeptidase B